MEHENLIPIRSIPYHSYGMVVYSTKIDESGELMPYRQMILAQRKSSQVLVERSLLRSAYNRSENDHQGHRLNELDKRYEFNKQQYVSKEYRICYGQS